VGKFEACPLPAFNLPAILMPSPASFAGEGQGEGSLKNSESRAPLRRALISVPHPAAATAAGFSHQGEACRALAE
jgi:hypothetical protein